MISRAKCTLLRSLTVGLAMTILASLPAWASPNRPAASPLSPMPPALAAELELAAQQLEAALSSGEPAKATAIFLDRSGPCYRWVSARWAEARRGLRRPKSWALQLSPYALHENQAFVRLTVWLHDEAAPPIQGDFDLKMKRLGGQWRVGEALALDRPDMRLEGLNLTAHSEAQGHLLFATLNLRPTGPDRHVYFNLPEGLSLVSLRLGAQPAASSQVGRVLHVELPPGPGPFALSVGYRMGRLPAQPLWWPKALGLSLEGPLQAQLHPPVGERAVASGMGQPIQGVELGMLHGAWGPEVVLADPMGTLSAHLRPEHASLAPMLLVELADARKQLGTAFGFPPQPEPWAIAEAEGADGSAGAALVALPPAWLKDAPLAAGGVMVGACRSWLARDNSLGTPAEVRMLTEALAGYLSLALHEVRDGREARLADLRELARRLAQQPQALAATPLAELDPNAPPPGMTQVQAMQALRARGTLLWALLAQSVGAQKLRVALTECKPRSFEAIEAALKRQGASHALVPLRAWMDAPMPMPWALESLRTHRLAPNRYELRGTFRLDGPTVPLELPLVLGMVDGSKRRFGVKVLGPRTEFSLPAVNLPTALWVDPLHESPLAASEAVPLEAPGAP